MPKNVETMRAAIEQAVRKTLANQRGWNVETPEGEISPRFLDNGNIVVYEYDDKTDEEIEHVFSVSVQ